MSRPTVDDLEVLLRHIALRNLTNRAIAALAQTPDLARRKRAADFAIGFWLSAALSDANEQLNVAMKLAKLLAIAQVHLCETEPEPVSRPSLHGDGHVGPVSDGAYTQPAKRV